MEYSDFAPDMSKMNPSHLFSLYGITRKEKLL
jgi:hypothetical protein